MRTCGCCGETKTTFAFSWNAKAKKYSPNCRDCGNWLRLLRGVFGPTRDWHKNVKNTNERNKTKRRKDKNEPANALYAAWGIGRPQ